jgi:hydrogenase large subunit
LQRFATTSGEHAREAVAVRQRWLQIMGTLGGEWPHTQSIVPGGSTRGISSSERYRLGARVAEMRSFLERVLYAAPLEEVLELESEVVLTQWQARDPLRGDLRLFLSIAQIAEDARHAWLADGGAALPPAVGLTLPQIDKPEAYTWNKAPRLDGQVLETGALARQLADGQPLIRALWQRSRGNVLTRVLARSLELARLVILAEGYLRAIVPEAECCVETHLPDHADAYGLCEAARGSLGHWLSIRDGRIANYQIIAPTSWNFSPRDRHGTPGALEAALVGAPVAEGDKTPVAVQHIVRSFDPCMVCTVH